MSQQGGFEGFPSENHLWDIMQFLNSPSGDSKKENKDMQKQGESSKTQKVVQMEDQKPSKKVKRKAGGDKVYEKHIVKERERRKKIRNLYDDLHALLPQAPQKKERGIILDETINYIRNLELTFQNLQRQKLEKMQADLIKSSCGPSSNVAAAAPSCFNSVPAAHKDPVFFQTYVSPNVVLNICGNEAQLSVCDPKKLGLPTTIYQILDKWNIGVVSAQLSCNRSMHMIQMKMPVEFPREIFKKAVEEIVSWIAS